MTISTKKIGAAALAGLASVSLAACATDYGPTTYGRYEQGGYARTETGTVVGWRPVTFEEGDLRGGTAAGAAVGAIGGAALGGDTEGEIAGGVLGAIAGALVGRQIQRSAYSGQGVAYTIELDDGELITVAQGGTATIPVNTRVFVEFGDQIRVYPQTGGAGYR